MGEGKVLGRHHRRVVHRENPDARLLECSLDIAIGTNFLGVVADGPGDGLSADSAR